MNLASVLTIVEQLAPVFKDHGLDGLNALLTILKSGETLPAPFDKLTPYIKEAEVVVNLFISVDKMLFPTS